MGVERPREHELTVGRYRLLEMIGAGGMGRVFRARDPQLDREVAVKLLRQISAEAQARMVREAQTMAALSHPNVLPIFDVGVDGDDLFIAVELVHGVDLSAWLAKGKQPWREVVRVFTAAGRGLEAAHAAGLVHRDFKPANVMLGDDGRVRVMDFGLARSIDGRDSRDANEGTGPRVVRSLESITRDGDIVGTPRYLAPELEAGAAATPSGDQYAFCTALYEALYGEPPFAADSVSALSVRKWRGAPSAGPPDTDVPRRLFEICERGLRVDPEERWPSMAALISALESTLTTPRRRIAVLGVATVAVATAALVWFVDDPPPRAEPATARAPADPLEPPPELAADVARVRAAVEKIHAADKKGELDAAQQILTAELGTKTGFCPADAEAQHAAGIVADGVGEFDRAVDELSAAYYLAAGCEHHTIALESASLLVGIEGNRRGKLDEAAAWFGHAKTHLEFSPDPKFDEGVLLTTYAPIAYRQGAPAEAKTLANRGVELLQSLDPPRPQAEAKALGNRGSIHGWDHEYDAMRADYERAAALNEQVFGPDHPELAISLMNLSVALRSSGDHEAAAEVQERGLAMFARAHGPDHPMLVKGTTSLGQVLIEIGRTDEGVAKVEEALALGEKALGPDHIGLTLPLRTLSVVRIRQERVDEAVELLQRVVQIQASAGRRNERYAHDLRELAERLVAVGRFDEARAKLDEAFEILEPLAGPDHRQLGRFYGTRALLLHKSGDNEGADKAYQRALAVVDADGNGATYDVAETLDVYAFFLAATGRRDEARTHLTRAIEIYETIGAYPETTRAAQERLEALSRGR